MNKIIYKILTESKRKDLIEAQNMEDDSFFQPKTKKRDRESRKRRKEISSKIKLGLQNINIAYENKNWESKEEKTFLQIFSRFHLDKKDTDYFLKYENGETKCLFDLQNDFFYVSEDYIWQPFSDELDWKYFETKSFIKNMLWKYFKLDDFMVMRSEWM